MTDLLGDEVAVKSLPLKGVRKPTPRNGYAGTPGCGPLVKSPACQKWEKKT